MADVFRPDLSPVIGGAVLGTLLAFPLDKLIPQNTGLSVTTLSVSVGFMVLIAVGLLAVAGPARRALRIDSTEALREGETKTCTFTISGNPREQPSLVRSSAEPAPDFS